MKRGRAWRRFQNERIIEKRLKIVRSLYSFSSEIGPRTSFVRSREYQSPGILKKYNLTCSCPMCRIGRKGYYNRIDRMKKIPQDIEYGELYA